MSTCVVMGGLGRVGSALAGILAKKSTVLISDVAGPPLPKVYGVRFLHVTIPWQEGYVEKVRAEADKLDPLLLIIHSTVPVETTRQFGVKAVHAPVRGQDTTLGSALKRFEMYVGGNTVAGARVARRHLKLHGISATLAPRSEATELTKLLDLSRFLNDLAWYENAERLYKKHGIPTQFLQDYTRTYNRGYAGTRFVRPNLDFPHGKVGGKCVLQNSRILAETEDDAFTRRALEVFSDSRVV